jgi:adenosine/AMP kinase
VTTTTLFRGVGPVDKPDDVNVVIGQRTSSRRVEDLHKALVGVSSSLRFGLAFCEASGPRLVRRTGNDPELVERIRYTEPASSPPAGVTNLDQYRDL